MGTSTAAEVNGRVDDALKGRLAKALGGPVITGSVPERKPGRFDPPWVPAPPHI